MSLLCATGQAVTNSESKGRFHLSMKNMCKVFGGPCFRTASVNGGTTGSVKETALTLGILSRKYVIEIDAHERLG